MFGFNSSIPANINWLKCLFLPTLRSDSSMWFNQNAFDRTRYKHTTKRLKCPTSNDSMCRSHFCNAMQFKRTLRTEYQYNYKMGWWDFFDFRMVISSGKMKMHTICLTAISITWRDVSPNALDVIYSDVCDCMLQGKHTDTHHQWSKLSGFCRTQIGYYKWV